jgi:hypothetical protein
VTRFAATAAALGLAVTFVAVSSADATVRLRAADSSSPSVSASLTAPNGGVPDGQNGWFVSEIITGQVSASDVDSGGSVIESLSCADSVDGGAPQTLALTDVTGVGSDDVATAAFSLEFGTYGHNSIVCSATDGTGGVGTSTPLLVAHDSFGPVINCRDVRVTLPWNSGPTELAAGLTDSYSGPATPTAATTVNTSALGSFRVSLTGYDNAGNATTLSCHYDVGMGFVGFSAPKRNATFARGDKLTAKFRLEDANGLLADAFAAQLAAGCGVRYSVVSGVTGEYAAGCASYDAASRRFRFRITIPLSEYTGEHEIVIKTYPNHFTHYFHGKGIRDFTVA